jgi:hypothetical protein
LELITPALESKILPLKFKTLTLQSANSGVGVRKLWRWSLRTPASELLTPALEFANPGVEVYELQNVVFYSPVAVKNSFLKFSNSGVGVPKPRR